MKNNQCAIRKQTFECNQENNMTCSICLLGQIVDSLELQTSAIANLTASMEDRIEITSVIDNSIKEVCYK